MANWNKDMSRRARGGAEMLDGSIVNADVADDSLTTGKVALVADVATAGGIPVLYRTSVASGSTGNVDITIDDKSRVVMAYAIMKGLGATGDFIQLFNGANAITNQVDLDGVADKNIVQIGQIDDAYYEIAAGGTLRWTRTSSGTHPGCECYVLAVKVS